MSKARILIKTIRYVAIHLTDEEISEIGEVLARALNRMEKESEERG